MATILAFELHLHLTMKRYIYTFSILVVISLILFGCGGGAGGDAGQGGGSPFSVISTGPVPALPDGIEPEVYEWSLSISNPHLAYQTPIPQSGTPNKKGLQMYKLPLHWIPFCSFNPDRHEISHTPSGQLVSLGNGEKPEVVCENQILPYQPVIGETLHSRRAIQIEIVPPSVGPPGSPFFFIYFKEVKTKYEQPEGVIYLGKIYLRNEGENFVRVEGSAPSTQNQNMFRELKIFNSNIQQLNPNKKPVLVNYFFQVNQSQFAESR